MKPLDSQRDIPKPQRTLSAAAKSIRALCVVISTCCVALCVCAGLNLAALVHYNNATEGLQRSIQDAAKPETDLATLLVRQQQLDKEFEQAYGAHYILLAQLSADIAHNKQVSQKLTQEIQKALDEASGNTSVPKQGTATDGTTPQEGDTSAAISEQDRKRIEQMLANQSQSQSESQTQDGEGEQTNSDSGVSKPW